LPILGAKCIFASFLLLNSKKCEDMEEKERKPEERNEHTKLTWEIPKLYSLDKGKTEGGATPGVSEDITYPVDFYNS
jgi:hypothetical protein